MKRTTTLILAALPLPLFAGETMEPVMAPPMESNTMMTTMPETAWLLGGSAGYLIDAEDEFFSAQFGKEIAASGPWVHSVYLEVGYSDLENDGDELNLEEVFDYDPGDSFTGDADLEATFIPITLNYKLDYHFTPQFSAYISAGAGIAIIDVDGSFDDPINTINESGNDSDTSFFAQAGAGLNYEISPAFEIFTGVRYMFLDDYSVTTDGGFTVDVDDNDDWLIEAGARFRF